MSARKIIISTFIIVAMIALCNLIVSAEAGTITLQNGSSYADLTDALNNAANTDTLKVSGSIEISSNIAIDKNITLIAQDNTAEFIYNGGGEYAPVIQVNNGNSLTLGDGDASKTLKINSVHLKITKGSLHMKNGIIFSSNKKPLSIVELSGSGARATIEGGRIENTNNVYNTFENNYLLNVNNGAVVDSISGGEFIGAYIAVNVNNAKVNLVSGGKFENSKASRQSEPAFKLMNNSHVAKITGGQFKSYRFGALQLESGSSVGEISGGTFENPFSTPFADSSGAEGYFSGLVLYGRFGSGPVSVEKISGGTFTGVNGILAIGSEPAQYAHIGSITGGTFKGMYHDKTPSAGLYFSQNSKIGTISGANSEGLNHGIFNAGSINSIISGTYKGKESFGILNIDLSQGGALYKNFKGKIDTISGGTFIGNKRGAYNNGVIDSINGGIFYGEKYEAVLNTSKNGFGELHTIKGGAYYAPNGENCIVVATPLKLEPQLASSGREYGYGRYYSPANTDIFNDISLVSIPSPYYMSEPSDTKNDVEGSPYSTVGFRYLRTDKTGSTTAPTAVPSINAPSTGDSSFITESLILLVASIFTIIIIYRKKSYNR